MGSKTYFNYGDKIESKKLVEAISMAYGPGPICGFGSATISGSELTVYPKALGDTGGAGSENTIDPSRYLVRDLISSHFLSRNEDPEVSDYMINFGVIAKDGVLFRSGDTQIKVNIEGNRGTYNQVILFAEHNYVSEAVNNTVTFRAYWNESSFDFYSLYKKASNIYYPSSQKKASISDENDPYYDETMSYDFLINKVKAASQRYNNYEKNLVLIGIYGEGEDVTLGSEGKVEKFAIVPYGGRFPMPIRYNTALHSYFKESISRVEKFLALDMVESEVNPATGEPFTNFLEYISWKLNDQISVLQEQLDLLAIPVGAIILYDGETIPRGWEEYTRAAGRVVIGYTAGGLQLNTTEEGNQVVLQNVGDIYDPANVNDHWHITISKDNLPKHYHGIGVVEGRDNSIGKGGAHTPRTVNFNERQTWIGGNWFIDQDSYQNSNGPKNIKDGAILSSSNLIDNTDPISETPMSDNLVLSKLPRAITLRYIKKTTSSLNVNEGEE